MTDGGTSLPGLVEACESLFERHGDTYEGMGWTKSQADTDLRYDVMLDVLRPSAAPVTLLDYGCGTGHLLAHARARGLDHVAYTGVDASARFVEVAREKFPGVPFLHGDLLAGGLDVAPFDYVVMNGLFTYRGPLSFGEMVDQWQRLVTAAMGLARLGVAFNVTSPYVDWERDDLFHVPVPLLTDFVAASPCPSFVVRHDYGLFECTVHAYRTPNRGG